MAALDNASSDETSRKRKIVCVQVETGNDSKSYEIAHQSTDNSEVDIILFTLRKKSKFLASKFDDPSLWAMFEKPSEFFQGMWSVVGDNSPIKDRSKMKLTFTNISQGNVVIQPLSFTEQDWSGKHLTF